MATTYCDLISSGITLSCTRGSNLGGVATVWLTSLPALSSFTANTTDVVTGIAMSGTNLFYKFEILPQSSAWDTIINSEPTKGILYYEEELKLFFTKKQTVVRNQVQLMAKNRIAAIVLDNNGIYWLIADIANSAIFGGLDVEAGSTANSGKAVNDQNGYNIVLKGPFKSMAREIQSSVVTTSIVDTL